MPSEVGYFDFEGARFGVRTWTAGTASAKRRDLNLDSDLDLSPRSSTLGQPDRVSSQNSNRRTRSFDGERAGSPVVLLHGFAQSARSWKRVAPAFVDGAHASVYALELVGHGESARPDSGGFYDIDFQARAVLAFCDFVARAEGARPVLVGYSMGGRVALCAAERAVGAGLGGCAAERAANGVSPDDRAAGSTAEAAPDAADDVPFRALVIESAGLGPADSIARDALAKRNAVWAARLREEGVASFMGYWESLSLFESQKSLDAATRAEVSAERLANDAQALAFTFERAGAQAMPARSETVRSLRALAETGVPVIYLAGALDAKYRAVAKSLESDFGHAVDVRIVPNAGHNTHLEQPDAFVSELLGGIAGK